MKRVYIANGMSKHDDENRPWFYATAKKWRDAGWFVVSPAEINHSIEKPEAGTKEAYDKCMKTDLYAIHHMVDAIALGPDYLDSRGANFEVMTGLFFGLPFYNAETMQPMHMVGEYQIYDAPNHPCAGELLRTDHTYAPKCESYKEPELSAIEKAFNYWMETLLTVENTPEVLDETVVNKDLGHIQRDFKTRDLERQLHAAMGMVGESAEVLELFKKRLFGYKYAGKKMLTDDLIIEEVGDVMWYVGLMCDTLGIDLASVLVQNADKLRVRYADKFLPADKPLVQPDIFLPELTEQRMLQSETQPLPVVAIMADGNGTLSHSGRRTVGGGKFTKDELLTLESAGINLLNESPSSWVPTTEDELRTAGILPS